MTRQIAHYDVFSYVDFLKKLYFLIHQKIKRQRLLAFLIML